MILFSYLNEFNYSPLGKNTASFRTRSELVKNTGVGTEIIIKS
jgi:hypothetical protein